MTAPSPWNAVARGLLLIALAVPAAPAAAWAQSTANIDLAEEADLQFSLGVDAYRKGDFEAALEHLLASNRLVPNKNVVYNIARCYEHLGRFPEAYRHYSDYVALETDPARRAPAEQSLHAIESQVALVEIATEPAGATIYVDRRDLGARGTTPRTLALEPGKHTILVDLPGYDPGESQPVDLQVGHTAKVDVGLHQILGTVKVDGDPPGAEIRVDDESGPVVGTIPTTLSLPPGPHVLVVSSAGHQTARQVVRVVENQSSQTAVNLALVTGTVVVNAIERDALIEIDGQAMGFTPAVLGTVPAGEHTLRVTLAGFRPFEQRITVAEDQQVVVDVRLRPLQEVTAASRQAQAVEDAPASVSLISAEEIRAFGYQTLYDALGGTRGVFQTNDLTYQFLGFRGFGRNGDYGNRVLVTMDGHTMNDDQLGASYVGHDLVSDLEDVERIEVVRGPGSALYGTNAFFGVLNLVTRDHDTTLPSHATLAADGTRQARVTVGASRTSADSGSWVSLGGVASQGRDYVFPELADDPTGGVSADADGERAASARFKAWKGDLVVEGSYNTRFKRIPTGAYETDLASPLAHDSDSRGYVEARYEPKLGDKARLYSRAYVDHYQFDGSYPYTDGDLDLYHDTWNGTWAGVEPRVVVQAAKTVDLTVGAEARDYFAADLHGVETCDCLVDEEGGHPGNTDVYGDEAPTHAVLSGYAVGQWTTDRLSASLGARADWFSPYGTKETVSFRGESKVSANPRLAIIAKPSQKDTIKLMGGSAFREPSPYESYYSDGGYTEVQSPDLVPEKIWTGEIEATHRFSDVTSLVGSAYYDQIQHLVDFDENADGLYQYANDDVPLRTAGWEAELRRDWRQGWMASVQYSWQRTRVGDLAGDERLTNSPEYLAAVKAAAPLPGGTTVASRLRWESPRLTEYDTWSQQALLWDVTLSGSVPTAKLQYAVGVRNLFDWKYGVPGGSDLVQETVPQPGRTLFAQGTMTF